MKSAVAILSLVASTSDAARLRAQTRALSTEQQMLVQTLGKKYDCHEAGDSLVDTIQKVVKANTDETLRLKGECKTMAQKRKQEWHDAVDSFNTAYPKVEEEETAIEKGKIESANSAFDAMESDWCVSGFEHDDYAGCGTVYGEKVLPSNTALSNANEAALTATTAHKAAEERLNADTAVSDQAVKAEKASTKQLQEANLEFQRKEDAAAAQKTKEVIYGDSAKADLPESAVETKAKEDAMCLDILTKRKAHIASDQLVLTKIEPLLEQLNICNGAANGKKNGNLLGLLEVETGAQLEVKCAAAKKSMQSLIEVGAVPTGSYQDFVARLKQETDHMNAEKVACDDLSQKTFNDAKLAAEKTETEAKKLNQENFAKEKARLAKQLEDFVAKETAKITALQKDKDLKANEMNQAVTLQTAAQTKFDALLSRANAKMNEAVGTKTTEINRAIAHKDLQIKLRQAALNAKKDSSKKSIDDTAKANADYCQESNDNLQAESNIIQQLTSVINTGGTSGSGLRVIGDDSVDTKAVNLEGGNIDFSSDKIAKKDDFHFVSDMNKITEGATIEAATDEEKLAFEKAIDECEGHSNCKNGATCVDKLNGYDCKCAPGYEGEHCETDTDDCAGNSGCKNGATCIDKVDGYECKCAAGFEGTFCERDINECSANSHNCDSKATCKNTHGAFHCTCNAGYAGSGERNGCHDINECDTGGHSCDGQAVCTNNAGSFSCACKSGYTGSGQNGQCSIIGFDGCYKIQTSGVHAAPQPAQQPAGWGLSSWHGHGAVRDSHSSWTAVHAGNYWPMVWKIARSTKVTGAYTIRTTKTKDSAAGWGLSSWNAHGAVRNHASSRVATHKDDHWINHWMIEESTRTPGTYTLKTTHHKDGNQPAGWGLSAWHAYEQRNGGSTWVYTHAGDHWLMDWKMEKVDCSNPNYGNRL